MISREKATIDKTKSHKMELCEKCQFYNKNCVTVSAQEMNIRPFVTKKTQIKGNINKYESNEFTSIHSRRSLDHSSSSSHNNITNNRVIPQNSRKYSLKNSSPVNYNNTRVNSANVGQTFIESENSVNYYSRNTMKTERFPETRNASTYSSRYVNTPKVNTHQR